MKLPSTKHLAASFILIALSLSGCKSRAKLTQVQSLNKIEASQLVESTLFHNIDFVLVDSTIERTATDTVTRVRHVRASKNLQSTYEATETRTRTDTASVGEIEIQQIPIVVESIKNREAWLRPRVRMALCIIFLIFCAIFVVFVKKFLPLHR